MNIGDKIRYFRTSHKLSQDQLSELAGINISTIRKYETGERNPKPDQLLKIADALGVSINTFLDFDIKTISDLLSLIFKMDEQLSLHFEAAKDASGSYDFKTLKMAFHNDTVNQKLLSYMLAVQKRDEYLSVKDATEPLEDDETYFAIENNIAELRNRLIDDSTVITKETGTELTAGDSFTNNIGSTTAQAFQTQELNTLLQDVLFDCSANELELIIKTAQTIKECLRKQTE